jgi:hypothetical protein
MNKTPIRGTGYVLPTFVWDYQQPQIAAVAADDPADAPDRPADDLCAA